MNERIRHWIVWAARAALALLFVLSGGAKLVGVEQTVEVFRDVGIGQWFRYATGGLELLGAALLVVPGRAPAGAALLAAVMVGAVGAHLFVIGGSALTPGVLLLLLVLLGAETLRDRGDQGRPPSPGGDRAS